MPVIESQTLGALANSGTTITASYPATVNSGDLIIVLIFQQDTAGTGNTITTPSGWTAGPTGNNENGLGALFYRTADGSEDSGTQDFTSSRDSTTSFARANLIRISDHGGMDQLVGLSGETSDDGGVRVFSTPTITPSADNTRVLTLIGHKKATSGSPAYTQPSGYTDVGDAGNGFQPTFGLAYLDQTTAAATGTLQWRDLTNAPIFGVTLSVLSAGAGSATIPRLSMTGMAGYGANSLNGLLV